MDSRTEFLLYRAFGPPGPGHNLCSPIPQPLRRLRRPV